MFGPYQNEPQPPPDEIKSIGPRTLPAVEYDIWAYQSWHRVGAFRGTVMSADFWRLLVRAAGSGKALEQQAARTQFDTKVLDVARAQLGYPAFDPDQDYLAPTQDWVSDQLAGFVTWYARHLKEERERRAAEKQQETSTASTTETAGV